jgi:hypothetical protein
MTAFGEIHLPQFMTVLPAIDWPNRSSFMFRGTAGGDGDLCSGAVKPASARHAQKKLLAEVARRNKRGMSPATFPDADSVHLN